MILANWIFREKFPTMRVCGALRVPTHPLYTAKDTGTGQNDARLLSAQALEAGKYGCHDFHVYALFPYWKILM